MYCIERDCLPKCNKSPSASRGDRVCKAGCLKDGTVHEFSGPVKLVLVDTPEFQSKQRNLGATFVAYANMMMSANTVIVLFFTLGFYMPLYTNAHIILCTIGYQFCMPTGILMLHTLNGASVPLNESQRKTQHIYIHLLGMLIAIAGTVLVTLYGEPSLVGKGYHTILEKGHIHNYTGFGAAGISGLCIFISPFMYFGKVGLKGISRLFIFLHRFLGMLAFFLSTICFSFGVFEPSMQLWLFLMGGFIRLLNLLILVNMMEIRRNFNLKRDQKNKLPSDVQKLTINKFKTILSYWPKNLKSPLRDCNGTFKFVRKK